MGLPSIEDRVNALRNETTRAKLIAEGIEAGDMKNLAHMLHPFGMDATPNLDFARQQSLLQLAEAEGKDPVEVYVERLLASEGREFFNFWMFGGNLDNQWNTCSSPTWCQCSAMREPTLASSPTPIRPRYCSAS